jgi:hypothetical protein
MAAHWVVIAAFAGQALPQAVKHDLVVAPGTALTATGSFSGTTVSTTTDALRSGIGAALSGVPFGFWQGIWSDPLGLVRGALPAVPSGTGKNTPLLQAARARRHPVPRGAGVRDLARVGAGGGRDPGGAAGDGRRAAQAAPRGNDPAAGPLLERFAEVPDHQVPGVTHAAEVWQAAWNLPNGEAVTGLAVDPAAYAALVAATEGYPAVSASSLAPAASPGGAPARRFGLADRRMNGSAG